MNWLWTVFGLYALLFFVLFLINVYYFKRTLSTWRRLPDKTYYNEKRTSFTNLCWFIGHFILCTILFGEFFFACLLMTGSFIGSSRTLETLYYFPSLFHAITPMYLLTFVRYFTTHWTSDQRPPVLIFGTLPKMISSLFGLTFILGILLSCVGIVDIVAFTQGMVSPSSGGFFYYTRVSSMPISFLSITITSVLNLLLSLGMILRGISQRSKEAIWWPMLLAIGVILGAAGNFTPGVGRLVAGKAGELILLTISVCWERRLIQTLHLQRPLWGVDNLDLFDEE